MDQLKETMWNITKDYTKGGVVLYAHVTSLFKVVCANICTNHLMRGYESLHQVISSIGWKTTWVVLSNGGKKAWMDGCTQVCLYIKSSWCSMISHVCILMHFLVEKPQKKYTQFSNVWKVGWKFNGHRVLHHNKPLPLLHTHKNLWICAMKDEFGGVSWWFLRL
jgi:hypothetical protein